ncbi:MAG: DNA polymerase I [Planctomycetota bacterium]
MTGDLFADIDSEQDASPDHAKLQENDAGNDSDAGDEKAAGNENALADNGDDDPKPGKRLFLLDGMALLYRAHFALIRSPRFTSAGLCTSGIFGMTSAVMDILKQQEPTHLAVCFDTEHPTERHRMFKEYKAQRDEMPEDLRAQKPYIDRLFEAFQIPIIRCPGYEADDVIGTLAHQAADQGFQTWMVTPDKDYDQLVRDQVWVYKPGRKGGEPEIFGVPEVLEKWGIEQVSQVVDILGLMGDASDNIPGVPGVGPKTAQKLIAQFGDVETLLSSTEKLKGKQKERVEQNADQARLSKRLVRIQMDVPHGVTPDELVRRPFDQAALQQLFEELEFQTLGKRLFGKTFSSANNRAKVIREKRESEIQSSLFDAPVQEKTIEDVETDYRLIQTQADRDQLLSTLLEQTEVCFDTETTGLDPRTAEPLGMAFSFEKGQAFYVDCTAATDTHGKPCKPKDVLREFQAFFDSPAVTKIGHNLKYDISLLKWNGVGVCGPVFDTMLAHSMKEPEMRHGLDYLSRLYLGYQPIPTEALIGKKGAEQKSMADVPLDVLCRYACEDADVTLQLAAKIRSDIEERGVAKVCYDVECPLVPVLVDMEYEGIRLDVPALERYSETLANEIDGLQTQIFGLVGHEFNIDSPKQLGIVLYEELTIEENPKKTATGQYTTREAELERLASRHEVIPLILEYRNARKLKSTYVDTLPTSVNEQTGHVHTHYSQTWTATGRMQSNHPNLQTIPIRKERGREIRAAFVPRNENFRILSADYSQIELRLMAELSGDASMMQAFVDGDDIHTITAAKVYKVDPDEVTREMRSKAKTVNFGIIYGISAFGLQQRLNIPRAEAAELIKNYFEKYPGVQDYIDRTIASAKQDGYVVTLTGRRRYLREINSASRNAASTAERLAMNSPIQGTAADILKLAMINVHRVLKDGDFETQMVLTVHDEIVFDMKADEEADVKPVIENAMKNTLDLQVPIEVEMGVGQNWLEAH